MAAAGEISPIDEVRDEGKEPITVQYTDTTTVRVSFVIKLPQVPQTINANIDLNI